MIDPRELEPDSIMPAYPWLAERVVDRSELHGRIAALRTLGVPYEAARSTNAAIQADYDAQASEIVKGLAEKGVRASKDEQIVALLAYLRSLGDNLVKPAETGANR